jgi:hypothetical protein
MRWQGAEVVKNIWRHCAHRRRLLASWLLRIFRPSNPINVVMSRTGKRVYVEYSRIFRPTGWSNDVSILPCKQGAPKRRSAVVNIILLNRKVQGWIPGPETSYSEQRFSQSLLVNSGILRSTLRETVIASFHMLDNSSFTAWQFDGIEYNISSIKRIVK